jgi:ATP-dependent helicase HrpB
MPSLKVSHYPIDDVFPELRDAVLDNPAVILHAPPGAGKTTRVPLALLDIFPAERGRILMLEPRRIAAVSAARWMAKTLGEEVGATVGYSIRFDRKTSSSTRIEVVTEGILTRRIQRDPDLAGVAMVIFDEFHERSLHADLALALCLDVRRGLRGDLKLLVMSATMECGPIASFLGGAPVITSAGKAFPVEERYLPDKEKALPERIAVAVNVALGESSGDILVFLPGAGEIRACNEALQAVTKNKKEHVTLHPLYGDLPFEEQERAILPSRDRKIVLATNIAETSLTIEGVRVVIDSGLTRSLRYDPSSGMNRLVTLPASKASSEQRKGRAGRLGPGICYRLYSRQSFHSMLPFSPPEILVSDLSSLVLELSVWGVRDPLELSWLDPPPAASWDAALSLMESLGGVDRTGSATAEGRAMAALPLHPRLSRLLLRAREAGFLSVGADLAALLSERDILRRKLAGRAGRISDERDPGIEERLDCLRSWRSTKRELCGADPWALRAVDVTSKQLMRIIGGRAKIPDSSDHTSDVVQLLLLCAFPDRIAKRRDDGEGRFLLVQGRGVRLPYPGGLSSSPFIAAVNVDAGERAEGMVRIAAPLTEELIRQECGRDIALVRHVEWDKKKGEIVAAVEERLGAISLSIKPFDPPDEEAIPLLCEAIKSAPSGLLKFTKRSRQFMGRAALVRRVFPDEEWPDLSEAYLTSTPETWLPPFLSGVRNSRELAALDISAALETQLSWKQKRLLDERAPVSVAVPSGRRVCLDYAAGEVPVLAVKLQEMFGLADTPSVAGGRVKALLHLLSPARRPVQITQDLKGFWNSGYQQVKRELKGRYPKHPWPDDPWNAVPTVRTKSR